MAKGNKNAQKALLDSLLAEFRLSIKPQIAEFRKTKRFKDSLGYFYLSDYSHKRLQPIDTEVDHQSPLTFRQLAYNFLTLESIDLNSFNFADYEAISKLSNSFASYHKQKAKLRILSSEGNRYSWLYHRKKYGDISYKEFFNIKGHNNNQNL
jgi:hypothetical protein